MKRFLIILLVAMVGLMPACGSEEEKAPVKAAAPPEKVEEAVPHPPWLPRSVRPQSLQRLVNLKQSTPRRS